MRRALVPLAALLTLCCATLPRQTRTDVEVSGGLGRAQWTEPVAACSGIPPAHQFDDQITGGVAVKQVMANGVEFGGSVEGVRETVTASRDHPTPPDGARDYLLGGGAFVGFRTLYIGSSIGGSVWHNGGMPFATLEAGKLDRVWGRAQFGHWKPFTDTRFATLGIAFRPFEGGELEIWGGGVAPTLYAYAVGNRHPADTRVGDATMAGGLTFSAQISEFLGLYLQVVGAAVPSGVIGVSFSPSALVAGEVPEPHEAPAR